MFQGIKEKYDRYERHFSSISIVAGFIFDSLTFRRIDHLFEDIRMLSYLAIAAMSITLLSIIENKREGSAGSRRGSSRIHSSALFALEFVFGGLFSAFFIFYFRSGPIMSSWPFLLIFLAFIIGNELLRERYLLFTFRMAVFFFALFSFCIFFLPILFGTMGPAIFIFSGFVSIAVVAVFIYFLNWLMPKRLAQSKTALKFFIGGLYFLLNILYFANIIPPIPLSLKDVGVFHYVERTSTNTYTVVTEPHPWSDFAKRYEDFHLVVGSPVYVYSAVFAPTNLTTEIVHAWQFYDENKKSWTTVSEITYPIYGGHDNGYRGYSMKTNVSPGLWRVNIETVRGQVIGRVQFRVIDVDVPPLTATETR